MYYADEIIDQVRESSDIVDVIGTYVHLNRRGNNYVGLCPFHNEKTGSFSVNKNMQIYKCFGCGKAGNVFTFMMEYDNLTFVEAVKQLADRAGISLPENEMTEEERQKRNLREKLFEVNKDAATYYYGMLRSEQGKAAYKYFTDRGLSDETIRRFGLGYAGKQSDGLYLYLKQKGYSDEVLKSSGIFTFSERGVYDKFWNRVVFPYMDKNGKVIAFGARIMGKAENVPKYLNSPETKIFIKGDNLYGMHLAKHSHEKYLLLCEGYMDTIALHQAGFDNTVGSMGTALTPRQAKLISNYVSEVVVTYDLDDAGRNAILRAIPILKNAGITVRVVNMSRSLYNKDSQDSVKDPDEFIRRFGADAYRKCIDEAMTAFEFEAEMLKTKVDDKDPAQKTKFDHELAKKLAAIEDEIERNNYIEAASRDYGIDHAALTRLVNRYGREAYINSVAEQTQEQAKEERRRMIKPEEGPVKSEQLLVSMLANNPEYYEKVGGLIGEEDFTDPLCKRLINIIFTLYRAGTGIVHASIVCKFEEVTDQEKVAGILNSSLYEENISESVKTNAFADLVYKVLNNSIDEEWQKAVQAGDSGTIRRLMNRRDETESIRAGLMGS